MRALEAKGWSQNKLQHEAELDQGDVSKLLTGVKKETGLTAPKFAGLCKALDVEPQWLLYGRGPMRDEKRPPTSVREKAIAIAHLAPFPDEAITAGLAQFEGQDVEQLNVMVVFDAIRLEAEKQLLRSSLDHEARRSQRERFKVAGKKRKKAAATKVDPSADVPAPRPTRRAVNAK